MVEPKVNSVQIKNLTYTKLRITPLKKLCSFFPYVVYQVNRGHRNPPLINKKTSHHDNNSKTANVNEIDMTYPSESFHRRVAHIEIIKVVNNRYSTPVTLKVSAVIKEKTVNIAQKNVIIFANIKLLDPTTTIKSPKGVVYQHPKDFPCSQSYQEAFEVIVDKNTHPKRHVIEFTL